MNKSYMISFLAFVICFGFSCSQVDSQQQTIRISGEVFHIDTSSNIVLSSFHPVTQERKTIATTKMGNNGSYEILFQIDEPDLYRIDFPGKQNVMLAIDQDQNQIFLSAEGKSGGYVKLEGSKDSDLLLGYDAFRAESNKRLIRPTYRAMREAQKSGDGDAEAIAVAEYVKNSKLHRKELLDYTDEYIGTSIALYGTVLRWTGDDEVARLQKLVDAFTQAHPDLTMTKVMQDKVERYQKIALGVKAPDIVSQDQHGAAIMLSEKMGKVTLIDFWASWCGPCIRQLPDLHKAYDAYHNDGFEIFSVSVDTKRDKWVSAIDKYEMDWLHASDVKGWQSEHAKDYNVTFVPFNLLIDERGIIIGKNLHSVTLQETVRELLKSSE